MNRLPHSDHHPHAFREVPLPSGTVLGVWADPLLQLATRGDWRVACAFSRPVTLDDYLVILYWDGRTWNNEGLTLAALADRQLSPRDHHAFQQWRATGPITAWFVELQRIIECAVTTLQATAVTALLDSIRQPHEIHLETKVQP